MEMGINTQRLVMPTRANLEAFDAVLQAAGGLVDMKRQLDRVDQDLRTLRAQREGFVPPIEHKTVSLTSSFALMLTVFRDDPSP